MNSIMEKFMIFEACNECNSSEDFDYLCDFLIEEYINDKECYISPCVRLALSIIIVGAGRFQYFHFLASFLLPMEEIGGCFWVVEEELLRFYSIYLFKIHSLRKLPLDNIKKILIDSNGILLRFPTKRPFLRSRITLLHQDLSKLLSGNLDFSMYSESFDFMKYSRWHLNWARKLLDLFRSVRREQFDYIKTTEKTRVPMNKIRTEEISSQSPPESNSTTNQEVTEVNSSVFQIFWAALEHFNQGIS